MDNQTHRVVIIGCGFAGLAAAQELRDAPVDVTVIDRTNHHLFQPLLYQVATGVLSEGDIAPPIREVLRRQKNARVLLGEVVGIDVDARTVTVDRFGSKQAISYDSLIVATGAVQSYFGQDSFARFAPGMKTIDDALELRGRVFGAFEMAEAESDPAGRRSWLTFAVVGAGPTGVELAGQLIELANRGLRENFRSINPSMVRVVLIEAGPALLPMFREPLRVRAEKDLGKLGVELILGSKVTAVDATGVELQPTNGELWRLEARTKIWAAGVQASSLGRMVADAAGAKVDRSERVEVAADCSLPAHPEVFVVGDMMSLNHLPGVAQVAMQSGGHAAKTITRRLEGLEPLPFKYFDKGTLATIARFRAIGEIGPLNASGFVGWLIWLFIHLAFLTGFRNRIAAVVNWGWSFIGRTRRQRTFTYQQVVARQAIGNNTAQRWMSRNEP